MFDLLLLNYKFMQCLLVLFEHGGSSKFMLNTQVSEGSQYLAFKVYNYWWSLHAKKVKRTMRSRLRWQEEQWNRNVDRCCLAEWLITEAREDSKAPWLHFTFALKVGNDVWWW